MFLSSVFPEGPSSSHVMHIMVSDPEVLGGAPAAIFNPALAALQSRLNHLDEVQVDSQDITNATEYLDAASRTYRDENIRERVIKQNVNVAIGRHGSWNLKLDWADGIKASCCWWHEDFLVMVMELKNTVGLDGNPLVQAIADYAKIISQEKYKPFRDFCNFPTVLLGIAENRIDTSMAVCIGEIHVTKLLTLDVIVGFLASDNIIHLARVFKALFSAMYIAALDGIENDVLVKFITRYDEKAHSILADAGFAPKLHFCARVVGGLYMVVMGRVDGKSVWELQVDDEPIPAVVLEQVSNAIGLLHEENIVFGDLRESNILYDASKSRAVVVEFDWAGIHDVDRYPATLNRANGHGMLFRMVLCSKSMICGNSNA
ncbi:hypothetical protein H0H81_010155 [Sphagnurus paluster]|uniref:Protein kinase domain-containing protein n=1 Tax=Sphagnurus paluster TaxID=117069 RepID=A0A9P7GQ88_9AGAR|nr:hypothetical protein H0H81_010155 [Sphagnurus paluster]